ncbi:MAG TPA: hypothetical protein VJZ77_06650 [Blastocatellia bacterium]|nr:hypothetical protein [Blastocatellia bacterium]
MLGFVVRIRDGAVEWVDVKRGALKNHQGVDLAPIFSHLEWRPDHRSWRL